MDSRSTQTHISRTILEMLRQRYVSLNTSSSYVFQRKNSQVEFTSKERKNDQNKCYFEHLQAFN